MKVNIYFVSLLNETIVKGKQVTLNTLEFNAIYSSSIVYQSQQ